VVAVLSAWFSITSTGPYFCLMAAICAARCGLPPGRLIMALAVP